MVTNTTEEQNQVRNSIAQQSGATISYPTVTTDTADSVTTLDGQTLTAATLSTSVANKDRVIASTPSVGNYQQPATVPPTVVSSDQPLPKPRPRFMRKSLVIGLISAIVIVLGLLLLLILRGRAPSVRSGIDATPDQNVSLVASPAGSNLSVLGVGTDNQLLVNADVVTTGSVYLKRGDVYGQIDTAKLSSSHRYVLPDATGTFCLDSNNCKYALESDIVTTSLGGVSGSISLGSGLSLQNGALMNTQTQTTLNTYSGAITLQGTPDQVNVTSSGGVISISAPQDIANTSAPTFAGITLTATGTQNGSVLCDISNNCGYSGGAGSAFLQNGNSFGATAVLGTNDAYGLNLQTSGIERISIAASGLTTISSGATIETGGASNKGLVVKGAASQTADLQQWQDSSGTRLSSVNFDGSISAPIGSSSAPAIVLGGYTGSTLGWWYEPGGGTLRLNTPGGTNSQAFFNKSIYFNNTFGAHIGTETADTQLDLVASVVSTSPLRVNSSGTLGTNEKFRVNTPTTVDNSASAIITTSSSGSKGLVIQASTGQTGRLMSFQDTSGNDLAFFNAAGRLGLNASTSGLGSVTKLGVNNYVTVDNSADVMFTTSATTSKGLVIQGVASQSANLQEWQDSGGTVLAKVDSLGRATFGSSSTPLSGVTATGAYAGLSAASYGGTAIYANAQSVATVGLKVQSASTLYTGDLQRWDPGGVTVSSVTHDGFFKIGATGTLSTVEKLRVTDPTTADTSANVMFATSATTSKGLVIQGVASQSANLQEWQDSTGLALAYVNSNGDISANTALKIGSTTVCTASGCTAASGSGSYIQNGTSAQTANFNIQSASASSIVAVLRAATGQTADLLQFQNQNGIVVGGVASSGSAWFGGTSSPGGRLGVTPDTAATLGLVVQGRALQTGDLQQWQNSAGTALTSIQSTGSLYSPSAPIKLGFNQALQGEYSAGGGFVNLAYRGSGNDIFLGDSTNGTTHVQASTYVQVSTGGGNTGFYSGIVYPISGSGYLGNGWTSPWKTLYLQPVNNSSTPLFIRGVASQTANLQEWQDSTGAVLASVNSVGRILVGDTSSGGVRFGSATGSLISQTGANITWSTATGGYLYLQANATGIVYVGATSDTAGFQIRRDTAIASDNAAVVKLTVKGAASQTANLQEWQNSSGTVLSSVNSSGLFNFGTPSNYIAGNAKTFTSGTSVNATASTASNWTLNAVTRGTQLYTLETADYGSPASMSLSGDGYSGYTIPTLGSYGFVGSYSGARGSGTRDIIGAYNFAQSTSTISADTVYGTRSTASFSSDQSGGSVNNVAYALFGGASTSTVSDVGSTRTAYGVYGTATSTGSRTTGIGGYFTTGAGSTGTAIALQATAGTASAKGLIVKGASSQTANLQEWQNSSGTVLASISSNGALFTLDSKRALESVAAGLRVGEGYTTVQTVKPLAVNGGTSPTLGTAESLRVGVPTTVDNAATSIFGITAAGNKGLVVQGASLQSANLQEWQNSTGTVLSSIDSSGNFTTGSNAATTGAIRLANNSNISWRNSGNTADIAAVNVDASNNTNITGNNNLALVAGGGITLAGGGGSAHVSVNLKGLGVANSGTTGPSGTVESFRVNAPTTVDNSANAIIATSAATSKGLVIQGSASQSANLLDLQQSNGTTIFKVGGGSLVWSDNGGNTTLGSGTQSWTHAGGQTSTRNDSGAAYNRLFGAAQYGWSMQSAASTGDFVITGGGNYMQSSDEWERLRIVKRNEMQLKAYRTTATVTNKSLTTNVATLTTSAAHGLVAGMTVVVSGVDATFDGTYTVVSTPLATTFTYAKVAADVPSQAATGSTIGYQTQTNSLLDFYDGVAGTAVSSVTNAGGLKIASTGTPGTVEKLRVNNPTTVDNSAATILSTGATTSKGLVVQGAASQTANLQEWQNSTGTALSYIDSSGNLNFGSSPGTAGVIRLSNNTGIVAHNAANNANITPLFVDSSNRVLLGDTGFNTLLRGLGVAVNDSNPTFGTVEKFRVTAPTTVDNSANVIIGTTATTSKGLVIQGVGSQTANLQEWQNSAGTVMRAVLSNGTLWAPNDVLIGGGISTGVWNRLNFYNGSTGDAELTMHNLNWYFSTTGRFRVSQSTVLGVGSDPASIGTVEKLRVNNPTTVDNSAATILSTGATTSKGLVVQGAASQTANLQEWQDSSGSALAWVRSNGEIVTNGIRSNDLNANKFISTNGNNFVYSTYGSHDFQLFNGTAYVSQFTLSTTTQSALLSTNASSLKGLVIKGVTSQSANLQEWQNSSGTVLTKIDANGILGGKNGSGTDSAGSALTIAGGQGTGAGNGGDINFNIAKPGSTGSAANTLSTVATVSGVDGSTVLQNATNGTSAFIVKDSAGTNNVLRADTTNDRVGIGTGTGAPAYTLDVLSGGADATTVAQFKNAGATSCTVQPGGTGFACSSDARLKTNVATVINPEDTIKALRGVTFNWITDPNGQTHAGFIAQELEQVIPSAVSTDSNGYKVANYSEVIPYLVGTAQYQDTQITGLQQGQVSLQQTQTASNTSLASLDSRVNTLEQKVSALESNQGNTNFASLNVSGPASIQTLTVTGSATIANLTVTGNATIAGNLTIQGHVLGNSDTRGSITVPAGQTQYKFTFVKPYTSGSKPVVTLTPNNTFAPNYRVDSTDTDFTVYFETPATTDVIMNYQVQQ